MVYGKSSQKMGAKKKEEDLPEPFDEVHALHPSTANDLLDHSDEAFDDERRLLLDAALPASWTETL